MDDVPPEMLEQGRLEPSLEAAQEYGGEHPDEFGGVYWAWDPMRVVFLATGHLAQHREALRGRAPHPDRVEVRRSLHTEIQIRLWLDEVYRRLHHLSQALTVTSWGQGLGDDGLKVHITIWPWSEDGPIGFAWSLLRSPSKSKLGRPLSSCLHTEGPSDAALTSR